MDCRCFMFDLVILNVWIDDFDYEKNSLTIEVSFNKIELTIESNPEKPGEFKQGRTCEFKAYPEDLGLDLLDHPLKLKILANGEEIKGEAEFFWPKEMLDKLERPNFNQYSHFDERDLKLDRLVAGKVSIQYRLRSKCELSESEGEDNVEKRCDIQDELKKIVDPNELFFLIQSDSDMCNSLNIGNKRNESCPTALDLSKFKNFHGKVVKDPGLIDRVYAPDCCHTKKYPAYGTKPSTCACLTYKPCLEKSTAKKSMKRLKSNSSLEWACKATQHIKECPHSNKFSDETVGTCSYDSSEFSVETETESSMIKKTHPCKYPQSPPVLKETVYIRPRFCPICKGDVSWLPKLAACPKCGHKPTPYTIERTYNDNLTADQILADWAIDSPKLRKNNEKTVPKRINRCACKNGKICAYCRIRKICKDVLKPKICRGPNAKGSIDSGPFLKDKSASKICKSSSDTDSRTHLAKVFSELQDLYNLKPVPQKRELDINRKCEKSFAVSKTSKLKRQQTVVQKKTENFEKSTFVEAKKKLCRKKLYNYKNIRKYPGTSIGHKTCVSSGKMVPGNMGWLWTANKIGIRSGWKPGAIRKPIKEIMSYFLKDYPVDSLNVSRHGKNKISKNISEELIQKPTLHICKKNGAYVITMRPIKEATLLKSCADPYVPMKPIQFRIVKNPLKACANEIKNLLKKKFDKCSCRRPIAECFCRTFLDKKRLEFELNKACQLKGIPNLKNSLILSDTSESETEFDFGVTPPAGVIKPQLKNKPDLACHETQYNEKDWIIKPTFPKPLNKYMKPFDATGGRTLPPTRLCAPVIDTTRPAKTRTLPVSGIVGGWGGVGGNKGAGRRTGGGPTNTKPLFCNLARRGKADTCCSYPTQCMPIC